MKLVYKLALAQLRMYLRDRQALFFAFFFPLFFMLALGYMVGNGDIQPLQISVVTDIESGQVTDALAENQLLETHIERDEVARDALKKGDRDVIVFLPQQTSATTSMQVTVLVNATRAQQNAQTLAILQSSFVDVEHNIRGTQPMFVLDVQDVDSRGFRYVDFLIPGLLAFMTMQLSIAGSGFNIVEYKRKGILKRMFVTPLSPLTFITSLILSRIVIILAQISVLLLIAKLIFDITITGSIGLLYLFVVLGSVLFLSLGFVLGGIAKTQNAVMTFGNLFIFPQVFLAGVFFAVDSLPVWIQPLSKILPLQFISEAMRQVANSGAGLGELTIPLIGIAVWIVFGIVLATQLFTWGEDA